jgi:menaquinone-dependent protoporphyrinogen oxidase
MRILVAWASRRGGTEGIAEIIADGLRGGGHDVIVGPAADFTRIIEAFDAVIVGSALYANRWMRDALRFVTRNEAFLRSVPTWFFSSGPLDDSAQRGEIGPVRRVAAAMDRVGALGHVTFGGRLTPDAKGFVAHAMARTHAGDWRDPERIRAWTADIARQLPVARPRPAVVPPGGSLVRLVAHGVAGWAATAGAALAVASVSPTWARLATYDVLVCVIFAVVAGLYFRPRGAREPLVAAVAFGAIFALLDLDLAGSVAAFWFPLIAIVAITAAVGAVTSMMPAGRPPGAPRAHPRTPAQALR